MSLSPSDFYFGATIGEGAYARVIHARLKHAPPSPRTTNAYNGHSPSLTQRPASPLRQREYGIKIMDKRDICKKKKVKNVMKEKKILTLLQSDLIVKLYSSFQCKENLYLVLDCCLGGEMKKMIDHFRKTRNDIECSLCCGVKCVQYYSGQIVRAIEYLHNKGVVHGDLKPENILLTADGEIKLADFGTALDTKNMTGMATSRLDHQKKCLNFEDSFEGTAAYVSPEVLNGDNVTRSVDLWALGCIIFQMLTGDVPFYEANDYLTFQAIVEYSKYTRPLIYPEYVPEKAQDLISRLLVVNARDRLGAMDISDNGTHCQYITLRNHTFYDDFCWDSLDNDEMKPPYTPPSPDWLNSARAGDTPMTDGAKGLDDLVFDREATPINIFVPRCL